MVGRCVSVVALLATSLAPTEAANWTMSAIRSIQGRIVSDPPVWDATNKLWVAQFQTGTDTFLQKYVASMDTVNTASVEGALMYLQSEGIDQAIVPGCSRKSNMSYVWFYDITIVQPTNAVAEYDMDTAVRPEFCPFVAMDNGICTPTSGTTLPDECLQYFGGNGQPNLGPCVGGETRADNPKAPYDNNVWFSYPNSCVTSPFGAKTDACRAKLPGGLCPLGKKPNGVNCTFSYTILGFVAIDDLVGITSMTSPTTGKNYTSRFQFCQEGGVEFNTNTGASIPFWYNTTNRTANANRSTYMMNYYLQQVADPIKGVNMKPFPNVTDLTSKNPPCYVNNPLCSASPFGCSRDLLAQVCTVCTAASPNCVVRPTSAAAFPSLPKVPRSAPPSPTKT
ncbi:hypothetical protein As57867_017188, partial [Aphanomyces stellatus]